MTYLVISLLHGSILEPDVRPGAHCIMQCTDKNAYIYIRMLSQASLPMKTYKIYVLKTGKNGEKETARPVDLL